jgi:hypothetical protein
MPNEVTTLPMRTEGMVNVVVGWLDDERVNHQLHAGRDWLIGKLRELIQRDYVSRIEVIESAEGGDLLARQALMAEFKEAFDNGVDMPATLKSYILRSHGQGEPRRGRGHTEWDNRNRDVGIFILASLISQKFNIDLTRSPASNDKACAAAVLAKALKRKGIKLEEKRIAGIITSQRKWLSSLFPTVPNFANNSGLRP